MKKFLFIIVSLITGLCLTAFSPASSPQKNEGNSVSKRASCVDVDDLRIKRIIDKETLYLRSGRDKAMLVRLSAPCTQMQEMDRLDFELFGSSQLCRKNDIAIYHSRFGETPIRCLIAHVKPLSEAEWRAIEDN